MPNHQTRTHTHLGYANLKERLLRLDRQERLKRSLSWLLSVYRHKLFIKQNIQKHVCEVHSTSELSTIY